jgi:hypothetical protein
MTAAASSARELLLAELIGDSQRIADQLAQLTTRLAAAETSSLSAAQSLNVSAAAYRAEVDDMLARLRVEFAGLMTQTTEHAAHSLVSQQAKVLEQAAMQAMRSALTREVHAQQRRAWLAWTMVSAAVSTLTTLLVSTTMAALR